MPNMLEQSRDFWHWFDTTQFSYLCVHPKHAKMFSIQMLLKLCRGFALQCFSLLLLLTLGAHVRGLQYLFCLCVCLCVCFPYSGTSRNQAYKQQYQRLQRDTGMKYKKGFFFKTLRSEVMASFTHLEYIAPASFQGS